MTQPPEQNSLIRRYRSDLSKEPYLKINLSLAIIIVLVLGYFAVFSPSGNNYPVSCIHERITGKPCPSCGLSHSLSLILRGNILQAYDWNPYGVRVFIFFISQLMMRVVFSIYYLSDRESGKQLIIFDITGSVIIFLITFIPFMRILYTSF
jgi:hypothetical protein